MIGFFKKGCEADSQFTGKISRCLISSLIGRFTIKAVRYTSLSAFQQVVDHPFLSRGRGDKGDIWN